MERFLRHCFTSKGIVCDVCIHGNPNNCHAHVLTTFRSVTSTGFGPKRRDMNSTQQLNFWREAWELQTNRFLQLRGCKERIDHRSLAAQAADSSTPHHNNKEVEMANTKPAHRAPQTQSVIPAPIPLAGSAGSDNALQLAEPMRPEWFEKLFASLEHLLRLHFPESAVSVTFSAKHSCYTLAVDGEPQLTVTKDRIAFTKSTDAEIALAIEVAIGLGWSGIRLNGSEDFKRRAYHEAIRRGFSPEDISGYAPEHAFTMAPHYRQPLDGRGTPRLGGPRGKI